VLVAVLRTLNLPDEPAATVIAPVKVKPVFVTTVAVPLPVLITEKSKDMSVGKVAGTPPSIEVPVGKVRFAAPPVY
jgi:hypothetical protein